MENRQERSEACIEIERAWEAWSGQNASAELLNMLAFVNEHPHLMGIRATVNPRKTLQFGLGILLAVILLAAILLGWYRDRIQLTQDLVQKDKIIELLGEEVKRKSAERIRADMRYIEESQVSAAKLIEQVQLELEAAQAAQGKSRRTGGPLKPIH